MKRPFCFLLVLALFVAAHEPAKRPLAHEDYATWNNIRNMSFSPDGKWLSYEVNPQQGDGNLVLFNLESKSEMVFPRGYDAVFSRGNGFIAFKVKTPESIVRQAKVEKKKPDEMPKDSLAIFNLKSQELEVIPRLIGFSIPSETSDWMIYHIEVEIIKQDIQENKGKSPEIEEKEESERQSDSIPTKATRNRKPIKERILVVHNPLTGQRETIEKVETYVISPTGRLAAAIAENKQGDTLKLKNVVVYDTHKTQKRIIDDSREGDIKQLNVSFDGTQLVWLHSADTTKTKNYDVWLWSERDNQPQMVISSSTLGMPEGFSPCEDARPFFSKSGRRLFLGTAERQVEEPADTLLPEERYSLDIWHWNEPLIQPVQQARLRAENRRSFRSVYHIRERKLVQLADELVPTVMLDHDNDENFALGLSPIPYLRLTDFMAGSFNDVFEIDVRNGQRTLVVEKVRSLARLSPGGKFITWFDNEKMHWMAYEIRTKQTRNISQSITVPLFDEENDLPSPPRPHGIDGWYENDSFLLINDRHDVWKVDPTGRRKPENITRGLGRELNKRFRVQDLEVETPFFLEDQPLVFSAFDNETKRAGFYILNQSGFEPLIMADASFGSLIKAPEADRFAWRQGTFQVFNDIYASDSDFRQARKVSDANPQQEEFLWGTVQLVSWVDFNNQPLQGLLYLPENLNKDEKYPMLVYFYERSSNGLHSHSIPAPSRSTINRPYCTSNGYIVFIPDITYSEGFPGESAFNAVVSGTKAMTERFSFIDRDNIGLQGQSWGGFQIAYLVTRTNMFKAAMAGAPVSNMVSAYGAIRWESGRSRQFQYEETQSRIGGTLWERPLRYIENSPVFFVDKIETPLLIMHNDDDGAVPWYQGIEMFMAMRRLNKPVWMLVYNNERHNLTRWPNRMDLSIRMHQFFDHYLKGAPAPVWMEQGIPAAQKGRMHGYELIINN